MLGFGYFEGRIINIDKLLFIKKDESTGSVTFTFVGGWSTSMYSDRDVKSMWESLNTNSPQSTGETNA